jgi:simple sugar transport system ATP-binding protein
MLSQLQRNDTQSVRETEVTSGGTLLRAVGLTKSYGHVQALRGADFDVRPGEIVALLGDNGAGKSTLVKVLSGVVQPDGGTIEIEGSRVEMQSPEEAHALGIEVVYQDLALAPDLDPAANVFLGRELTRQGFLGRLGFLDQGRMRQEAGDTFRTLGMRLPSLKGPVGSLSGGQQQGIAVCRAAKWVSRILFMDEPTAALGVRQKAEVLDLVKRVRDTGVSIVYITHNLPEVFEISDRIEVMYLGGRIASMRTAETTSAEVVAAMTGIRPDGSEDLLT